MAAWVSVLIIGPLVRHERRLRYATWTASLRYSLNSRVVGPMFQLSSHRTLYVWCYKMQRTRRHRGEEIKNSSRHVLSRRYAHAYATYEAQVDHDGVVAALRVVLQVAIYSHNFMIVSPTFIFLVPMKKRILNYYIGTHSVRFRSTPGSSYEP